MKLQLDPDNPPLFTWRKGELSSWPLAIELRDQAGVKVLAVYWGSLFCELAQYAMLFYRLPNGAVIKFQPKPQRST